MRVITQRFGAALLTASLFTACSRPVAHFQPSAREQFTSPAATVASVETTTPTTATPALPAPTTNPAEAPAATPAQQIAQASAAVTQLDAYVRNDGKLAADKKLNKRMDRVRQLLATASTKAATASPQKMNLLERMATKRLDKQIKHKLGPEQTKRAMASTGILAAGAIAVIVGLLILLLGNSATLGVIVLLAGAIVLVVGLLA